MKLSLHSITTRIVIVAFAFAVWMDATNIFGLGFEWVYPLSVDTDGGPTKWYGFPFPYSIDAQYTSMARYSMPHIWLLNMTICTTVFGWVLRKFTPKIIWQMRWGLVFSWIGLFFICAYFMGVLLFSLSFDLVFVWNANPYGDYENISIFDLRPRISSVYENTSLSQSDGELVDAIKSVPNQPSK